MIFKRTVWFKSFLRIRGPSHPSFGPFGGTKGNAERRGRARWSRWSLIGLGAELRSLSRHGLETSLDAGDGAAGVARFTLQEIQAGVLLQDGLRGAASVTRHVFLCQGERAPVSNYAHREKLFNTSDKLSGRWQKYKQQVHANRLILQDIQPEMFNMAAYWEVLTLNVCFHVVTNLRLAI